MGVERSLRGRVRIWDLPTRLFHWSLVACVCGSVISAKLGGNAMVWHMRFGYATLTLIAFRLAWGFCGGRWSRFRNFIVGPAALWRYVSGRAKVGDHFEVGHSPLGALSVVAMLGWLLLQIGSGLIADDEIAITGPLVRFVSGETSLAWTGHHKGLGQWVLYGLVAIHVAAILFYRFGKGRDLIAPMFSGDKRLPPAVPSARDSLATRVGALLLLALCAGAVGGLVSLGG